MRLYKYTLEDSIGFRVRGKILAEDKIDAIRRLPSHTKIIKIRDAGKELELPEKISIALKLGRVKQKDLSTFLEQLSSMLKSGLSVIKSLDMLSGGSSSIAKFSKRMQISVNQGKSISEAFYDNEYMLKDKISSMVKAGQQAGKLEETLLRISEQIKTKNAITSKVRGAMVYPCIVLSMSLFAMLFLFTTVVPQTITALEEINPGNTPAITKFVASVSDVLIEYGIVILILSVIVIYVLVKTVKKLFMLQLHFLICRLPIIGEVIRYEQCIIFFQNLVYTIDAGFTMSEAVKMSTSTLSNSYVRKCLETSIVNMGNGDSLMVALGKVSILKESEIRTIEVGSSTGEFSKLLGSLIEAMKLSAEESISVMIKFIEPLTLVIVGAVVGVLMLAVYLPTFSMMS